MPGAEQKDSAPKKFKLSSSASCLLEKPSWGFLGFAWEPFPLIGGRAAGRGEDGVSLGSCFWHKRQDGIVILDALGEEEMVWYLQGR